MTVPTIPVQKKRLEWLDAMRGFTMILVVSNHIMTNGFGIIMPKETAVQNLLLLFRMPLFFFVSGFLAYSAKTVWDGKTLGKSLLKKLRVQMLPTIVFLFAYLAIFFPHFDAALMDTLAKPLKNGYWFTYVLLLMFICYYLFAYLEAKVNQWTKGKLPSWVPILVLWLIAMFAYETNYMPKYFKYMKEEWCNYTSFAQLTNYFCFFVTGNVCRRYWSKLEKLFDTKWFFAVVVVMALVCCLEFFKWHYLRMMWANLPRTLAIFSLLGIVIMSFRYHEATFSKQTRLGRAMQYIGTRTLDIYLIHYFFLPKLTMVGPWLRENKPGTMIEMVMIVSIGLLVIGFSLVASNVLRTSPIFRKYLFGQKQ